MKPLRRESGSFSFFELDLQEAQDFTIAAQREPFVAFAVRPGFAMRSLSILQAGSKNFHRPAEGARVRWSDGAHQVVDLERAFRPVDAAVLGPASAAVAGFGQVLLLQARRSSEKTRQAAFKNSLCGVAHLAEHLDGKIVGT